MTLISSKRLQPQRTVLRRGPPAGRPCCTSRSRSSPSSSSSSTVAKSSLEESFLKRANPGLFFIVFSYTKNNLSIVSELNN